jgi:transcriptional regulator with XRE-family HTH domain
LEPKEIGRRISAAREKRGWTQMRFANEANVSMSSVQRWEAGKLPPVRELMRLAEVLGIPTEDLVEPEENVETLAAIREQLSAEVARFGKLNDRLEARLRESATQPRPRRKRV